jgi:hypothetical protein
MRGAGMTLLAAALAIVPIPPRAVERVYASGLYPVLQPALTWTSNRVPFAWLDLFIAAVAVWLVVTTARSWRGSGSRSRRAVRVVLAWAQLAAVLYLMFLLLWGFNYRRVTGAERFQVEIGRVTHPRLSALGRLAVARLNDRRPAVRDDARLAPAVLVSDLAPAFARAEFVVGTTWRAVPGIPKWSVIGQAFPWAGVDGMVNPFGLEVILNPEVLPFERPFVLAHEWAHLAGHAPESEASFVAFLTCLQGSNDAAYSAWLDLLLHVLRSVPVQEARALVDGLGRGPSDDLRAIEQRLTRVHPAVHRAAWAVYDEYLRANRVESGVANYDEVVTLVLGSGLSQSAIGM